MRGKTFKLFFSSSLTGLFQFVIRMSSVALILNLLHKNQFTLISKTFLDMAERPGITARTWIPR